ncbi:MAG: aldehyde dehydrogenase family protein, partial [Gammaproteobacteria bacterium]
MNFTSINPANGEKLRDYPMWDAMRLEQALVQTAAATPAWNMTSLAERTTLLRHAGEVLLKHRDEYAALMSREMGKLIGEARAEIEKCARCCEFYAENAAELLADEAAKTDASKSYLA